MMTYSKALLYMPVALLIFVQFPIYSQQEIKPQWDKSLLDLHYALPLVPHSDTFQTKIKLSIKEFGVVFEKYKELHPIHLVPDIPKNIALLPVRNNSANVQMNPLGGGVYLVYNSFKITEMQRRTEPDYYFVYAPSKKKGFRYMSRRQINQYKISNFVYPITP